MHYGGGGGGGGCTGYLWGTHAYRPTVYRVAQKERNSRFFRTLLWSTVIFFTLLDRTSFPHYNNTKIIKFGWKPFILWVISYGLSFSGFAINLSLVGGPPKNGTVNILGLCPDEQLFLSPCCCWIEHLFLIYNDTKIIKVGWILFLFYE